MRRAEWELLDQKKAETAFRPQTEHGWIHEELSSVQNSSWLMTMGDYTTQYIGDYNNKPIVIEVSL